MKRRVVAIAITLLAVASIVFAGSNGLPSPSSAMTTENDSRPSLSNKRPNRKSDYVDMKSDEGWQMTHNGKKIMVVVGNFAAHHNGAVITADSAVRYSERHIECFGNVLINKGTTYIYGDRAEYNGDTNEAKVFSNIVKVVDGSATLLTYNFTFNTKSNIGHYTGGGVLVSNDNILESERGYVYSDKHQIICVDRVQMQNNEYDMLVIRWYITPKATLQSSSQTPTSGTKARGSQTTSRNISSQTEAHSTKPSNSTNSLSTVMF